MRPSLIALMTATLLLLAPAPATAQVEAVQFADSQREALYKDLLDELRCLVCANQSLSDSNAGLAGDLRARVYEMVAEGQDRAAIIDYMVARYGDYVLYRPRLSTATLFLWFAPFVVVAAGLALVLTIAKRRRRAPSPTPAQQQKARALLNPDGDYGRDE